MNVRWTLLAFVAASLPATALAQSAASIRAVDEAPRVRPRAVPNLPSEASSTATEALSLQFSVASPGQLDAWPDGVGSSTKPDSGDKGGQGGPTPRRLNVNPPPVEPVQD